MGTIEVPNQYLSGCQTKRSLHQFNISTEKMPQEFILALARVKRACVLVNAKLGLLSSLKTGAILLVLDDFLFEWVDPKKLI